MEGGTGNDTLDGGADGSDGGFAIVDVARYIGNIADYTITNNSGTVTVTDNNAADGDEGTDTLTNIEALSFKDAGFVRLGVTSSSMAGGTNYEGTRFADSITGTSGDDFIRPGVGTDTILAGSGTDTVALDLAYSSSFGGGAGTYTYSQGGNSYTLTGVEIVVFTDRTVRLAPTSVTVGGSIIATGTDFGDNLSSFSGSGDDNIDGGAGGDTITGGVGNDFLTGGTGDDSIDGGAGTNDIARYDGTIAGYSISRSGSTFTITDTNLANGNDGTDTVTNVEALSFKDGFVRLLPQTFTASDNLSAYTEGTQFADTLTGDGKADFFDGKGGADTIDGGGGEDNVRIHADLSDATIADIGNGSFTVTVGSVVVTVSNVEGLAFDDVSARLTTYISTDGKTRIGTEILGDAITGSSDNDFIDGRASNDTLNGGDGADLLVGGAGNDTLNGGANATGLDVASYAGNFADYAITASGGSFTVTDTNGADGDQGTDTLTDIEALQFGDRFVRIAVETISTGQGGNYVYGTVVGETITGTADDDGILGREGDDTINGGGGDDYIDGGKGADTIALGTGASVIRWLTGDGNDSITGFSSNDVLNINATIGRTDASLSISTGGGNTIITIGGTETVTLIGFTGLADANFGTG